jgi:hypothetical protein
MNYDGRSFNLGPKGASMFTSKTSALFAAALLAVVVGRPTQAGTPLYGVSSPVFDVYTSSGSSSGDNRPCEFFIASVNGNWTWFAIPWVYLGSNAQALKVENAHQEYLKDPNSPNAVVSFLAYGPVANCTNALQADGIR